MIIFHGVDITSVASVKIEDVRISPVSLSPVSRARAIAPGQDLVRVRPDIRTVTVTFALLNRDMSTRLSDIDKIDKWARSGQEYKLAFSQLTGRYLMATCTEKPTVSLRRWWEDKMRLVFTCFNDPFWNSETLNVTPCGTMFEATGDAPPLIQIANTLSESASNQSYSMDGKTMTFSTIPAGYLIIDLNRQTAEVDGVSIMQYYNANSQFPVPSTGTHTVTGTGLVYCRDRWT